MSIAPDQQELHVTLQCISLPTSTTGTRSSSDLDPGAGCGYGKARRRGRGHPFETKITRADARWLPRDAMVVQGQVQGSA
eukprot:COSAG02_NODE_538_length_20609_cov_7.009703_11_plen_80_part_00